MVKLKIILQKKWQYNDSTLNEDCSDFSLSLNNYEKYNNLDVFYSKNSKLTFKIYCVKPFLSLQGFSITKYLNKDTIFIYGEYYAPIKLFLKKNGKTIKNKSHLLKFEFDNEEYLNDLQEKDSLYLKDINKVYTLKLFLRFDTTIFFINSLPAPQVFFSRVNYSPYLQDFKDNEYGFDNYSYHIYDSSNFYQNNYKKLFKDKGSIYYSPYITIPVCKSIDSTKKFSIGLNIVNKQKNYVRYKLKTNNKLKCIDKEIKINTNNFTQIYNITNETENFDKIFVTDNRNNKISYFMLNIKSPLKFKKYYYKILILKQGTTPTIPSNLNSLLNQQSFYQAFTKWENTSIKILNIDSILNILPPDFKRYLLKKIVDSDTFPYVVQYIYKNYFGGTENMNQITDLEKIIFFYNKPCIDSLNKQVNGFTKGAPAKYVFYFPTARISTYPHELGHSTGLHHTFRENKSSSGKLKNKSRGKTYNFMDYSKNRYEFWYWQWNIINNNLNK